MHGMIAASRPFTIAVSLFLTAAMTAALQPLSGQPSPQRVITDTPQYCLELLDRVSALLRTWPTPPQEVTSLSSEGQRMCDQGQTRSGIMRLRRALVLLRSEAVP